MRSFLFLLPLLLMPSSSVQNPGPMLTSAFISSIQTLTLGNTATGTTLGCGYQGICETPILFNSGTSYTLSNVAVNVAASGGQIIVGIYNSGTASCPSGASFCANTLLCQTAAFTPTVGVNTIPAASFGSCGSFSPNNFYFLAVETSSSGTTLNSSSNSYCTGTGYFEFAGSSQASFALPTSMGTQTETAGYCPTMSATFTCSGSCGATAVPWAVWTYAGNTAATAVTTANLVTGASGLNGAMSGSLSASTTYVSSPVQALKSSVNINGTTYTGGTLSINRATNDYWTYAIAGGAGGSPNAVALFWVYNTGNAEVNGDQFDLGQIGGGNTITFGAYGGSNNCTPGTAPCFRVERSGGTTAFFGTVPLAQSTWYALAILNVNSGTNEAAVFDTTGTQVATQTNACADGKTICIPSDVTGYPNSMKLGCDGSCATDAGTWYYGPTLYDPTGTTFNTIGSTYGEIFFPDSPQVIGYQLSKMVRDGVIPHATWTTEGWHSYALGKTLGAGNFAHGFADGATGKGAGESAPDGLHVTSGSLYDSGSDESESGAVR